MIWNHPQAQNCRCKQTECLQHHIITNFKKGWRKSFKCSEIKSFMLGKLASTPSQSFSSLIILIKLMRAKRRNWTCSNYRRTSRPPACTPRAQEVTRESRQWLITIGPPLLSHRASASVAPDAKIINAVAVIPGPCSHGNEKIFPQEPSRLSSSS